MLSYYVKSVIQTINRNKVSLLMHIAGILLTVLVAMYIGLWIHEGIIHK